MGYQEAVEDIVKRSVEKHPKAGPKWKKREATGDWSWVNEQCNHGQGPFKTDEAALCYCMTYLHFHYEAARITFEPFAQTLRRKSHVAMLDIGCGPMTAALALSELNTERHDLPLTLNYVGVDISAAMRRLAERFSKRRDCFSTEDGGYYRFLETVDEISTRRLECLLEDTTHIVMVFYYLFSQRTLTYPQVDSFANLLRRVRRLADGQQIWIVHTNAFPFESKFQYFRGRCSVVGIELSDSQPSTARHHFNQHRLARNKIVSEKKATTENLEFLAIQVE